MVEVPKRKAQLARIDGVAITIFRTTRGSLEEKKRATHQALVDLCRSESEAVLLAGITVGDVEYQTGGGSDSPNPRIRLTVKLDGLDGKPTRLTRPIEIIARSGKAARVAGVHASRKVAGTMAVDFRSTGPRRPS